MPSSKGSSQPRDRSEVSISPALAGEFFTTSTTWEDTYLCQAPPEKAPEIVLDDGRPSRCSLWGAVSGESFRDHRVIADYTK